MFQMIVIPVDKLHTNQSQFIHNFNLNMIYHLCAVRFLVQSNLFSRESSIQSLYVCYDTILVSVFTRIYILIPSRGPGMNLLYLYIIYMYKYMKIEKSRIHCLSSLTATAPRKCLTMLSNVCLA